MFLLHAFNSFRNRSVVLWMDKGEILFSCGRSVLWVEAVKFVQLIRPIVARIVERPTAHVSKALPFAEIKLALLQSLLCPHALSDVLRRTEHLVGSSGRVFFQIAQAVHDTHFPARTKKPVFTVTACPSPNALFSPPK